VETGSASRWQRLAPLLACPDCGGGLSISADGEEGEAVCSGCGARYGLSAGVLRFAVPERRGDWDLQQFEETYKLTGYFEEDWQWREKQGIPREVTDYDFPRIKGRLIEWLQPEPGCVHLDVGCGVGHFFYQIARRYPDVSLLSIGLEITDERLRWLAERVRREGEGSIFPILGVGEALPLADASCDRVTCTEVLEHVADPAAAVAEMARVLRGGGLLLLTTPSRGGIEKWERLAAPLVFVKRLLRGRSADDGPHAYDEPLYAADLRRILEGAGLELMDFSCGVAIPQRYYLARLPRWLMRMVLGLCGFFESRLPRLAAPLGQHCVLRCRKPE